MTHKRKRLCLGAIGKLNDEYESALFGNVEAQCSDVHWSFMPAASRGDWLKKVKEAGQNLKQFQVSRYRNVVTNERKTLYVTEIDMDPLWDAAREEATEQGGEDLNEVLRCIGISEERSKQTKRVRPSIDSLRNSLETFTMMPTVALDRIAYPNDGGLKWRIRNGRIQVWTTSVQERALQHLPEDAYAILCVCDADLYANERNSGLMGEATLDGRVAVMSPARYDALWKTSFATREQLMREASIENERRTLGITRCLHRVVLHETLHAMGMRHCIFFRCIMNGGSGQPSSLCPVCLRKLYVHVKATYEQMCTRYVDVQAMWAQCAPLDVALQIFLEKRTRYLAERELK